MKIFPPISEMLWPPGRSIRQNIQRRALPATVIAAAILATIAWSGGPSSDRYQTACTAGAACHPDSWQNTKRSAKQSEGAALETSVEFQLTAADRAIRPPQKQLRPSLWRKDAEASMNPSSAQNPEAAAN